MRKYLPHILFALFFFAACKKDPAPQVVVVHEHIRAHVMMSFGFNNLSSALTEDINDMTKGYVPGNTEYDNYLFVFSHRTADYYNEPTSPVLERFYRDAEGKVVREKLKTFEPGTVPNKSGVIKEVLEFLRDSYPDIESYGVLMSSHGTGWAPPGYCSDPSSFEGSSSDDDGWLFSRPGRQAEHGTPCPLQGDVRYDSLSGYYPYQPVPDVKSFGATVTGTNPTTSYETDIKDLADAIPFKLDYLVFDACFMGGVEVAYELKDKCRYLCASQTEILSDGMDYFTLVGDLLEKEEPDMVGLADNYYRHYNEASGSKRSATISVIDCAKLDVLAAVCRNIFRRYDIDASNVQSSYLQKYFHYSFHAWFYDLYSIVEAAGRKSLDSMSSGEDGTATGEYAAAKEQFDVDLADLQWALDACVLYKAATPTFALYGFPIRTHSGLSMYLPDMNRTWLNSYYSTLSWNKICGLVK